MTWLEKSIGRQDQVLGEITAESIEDLQDRIAKAWMRKLFKIQQVVT